MCRQTICSIKIIIISLERNRMFRITYYLKEERKIIELKHYGYLLWLICRCLVINRS
jgi:hypothetical protein